MADVKVVCSWCKKVMKEGPEDRVSHGVCEECLEKHFPETGEEKSKEEKEAVTEFGLWY